MLDLGFRNCKPEILIYYSREGLTSPPSIIFLTPNPNLRLSGSPQ